MGLLIGTRFFIVVGFLFACCCCVILVLLNDPALPWLNFFYGILFSGVICCFVGLWHAKLWAWWLGLILAVAALALGLYFLNFAWTFWIFKEPSILDRIFAVLHPRVLIFTLFPLIWIGYFIRPRIKEHFIY